MCHHGGTDLGPLPDRLSVRYRDVDAAVRGLIRADTELLDPGGAVEGLAVVPVAHPRDPSFAVGPLGGAAHVLRLVAQIDLVGAGDGLVPDAAVVDEDRPVDDLLALVGGQR